MKKLYRFPIKLFLFWSHRYSDKRPIFGSVTRSEYPIRASFLRSKRKATISWLAKITSSFLIVTVGAYELAYLDIFAMGQTSKYKYTIVDLGTLSGTSSFAEDINEAGEIVGSADVGRYDHGFLWKRGRMRDLGRYGYRSSRATSINNSGLVVGTVTGTPRSSGTLEMRGILWKDNTIVKLPLLAGGRLSRANAINYKGEIVGLSEYQLSSSKAHACLWDSKKAIDLGTLGGSNSEANDINNNHIVVGASATRNEEYHACLWDSKKAIDLGTLGGKESIALAINETGAIVGNSEIDPLSGDTHAFLYSKGRMRDLGTLSGFNTSIASDINDSMQIVGRCRDTKSKIFKSRAVLWNNGHLIDLNRQINPKLGWTLEWATGINNRGEIVGSGRIGKEQHAFLLKPR